MMLQSTSYTPTATLFLMLLVTAATTRYVPSDHYVVVRKAKVEVCLIGGCAHPVF
jgi:hypothetical protein